MLRLPPAIALALVAAAFPFGFGSAPAARALAAPEHSIIIGGSGVTTWPTYSPAIDRYAVRPDASTDGTVTVTATTTDPAGTVRLNGRPVSSGVTTPITGLDIGDEVNVSITDEGGTTNQSFIYLAPGFPTMTATSAGVGPSTGFVFLTTTSFLGGPRFETVVDRNAVPIYLHETLNPMDLKLQPNGHYSVARGRTIALDSTFDIVELDERFQPVTSHTTQGLVNTEFHDSILETDGGRILMAYEPNQGTGLIDSVVQDIGPDGNVVLTWNSADHVDPAVDGLTDLTDYAHLNSIDVMADNNLLLSFRHLSQVMKIDRTSGEVLWRLGGVNSDFTFPDDPYGGPCAQHTARELANGNIELWDNGSQVTSTTLTPMCPDPADPAGPPIERPFSRVVEYSLDPVAHTAHLVRQVLTGEFSEFAGSAQRLGGRTASDNTLIGTAFGSDVGTAQESPDVLEIDAGGTVVWSLEVPGFFSYRAAKFPAPDAIAPEIDVSGVSQGAVFEVGQDVQIDHSCSDRGGSNLLQCTTLDGDVLDTTVGHHSFVVTATDVAGNETVRSIGYTVRYAHQPDLKVRKHGGAWVGKQAYGPTPRQQVTFTVGRAGSQRAGEVAVVNDGLRQDRFDLHGAAGNAAYVIRYFKGSDELTAQIVAGTLRTPLLQPGEHYRLRVVLRRTTVAVEGSHRTALVDAISRHDHHRHDIVAVVIRAS